MTDYKLLTGDNIRISTHTLRKEGDQSNIAELTALCEFQPTPSARRVTDPDSDILPVVHISTHTLRKEGDQPHLH